jgi:autotransporter-associated beta strand protein
VVNDGTLEVHRGQFLGGRPVVMNGGTLNVNEPVSQANSNTILTNWNNNFIINGNSVVGGDDNGESADAGTGNGVLVKFGSLTFNNGATLGLGNFTNGTTTPINVSGFASDFAFMGGATFNGRATLNMGVGRTSNVNLAHIISGPITGSGFDVVSYIASNQTLILGGTQLDTTHNTFNSPVFAIGASTTIRLNKANGFDAIPNTPAAEDLVINGSTVQWGAGHHGDLLTTNDPALTNNGLLGIFPLSPTAIRNAGMDQVNDNATITLLTGTLGEADRINNDKWGRLVQKNGTFNVGLGALAVDVADISGGSFSINNGGTFRAGALNLLPGAYSPNITTGALANPALPSVLEIGAGGLSMSGQNIILGGGSSGNLAGAGAVLRLGGNVSAVDDPLNANSYFQGIWIQVGNSFRETGNSKIDLLGGDRTFTIDEDVQFLVSTPLSNGGLVKSGAGTLILQPYLASDFAGAVTVSNGVLAARGNGAFGTGAGGVTINSGGTVKLESGWSYSDSFSVSGPGAIVPGSNSNVREPGALVSETGHNRILPAATFTLIGGATIAASTVQMPAATPVGAVFPYSRSHFSIESAGGIGGTGLLTLSGAGDGIVLGGVNVSGTGNGVTKDGSGRWVLAGPGTYTGATTILAGPLRITNAQALGDTAAGTTVFGGGALELIGGITIAEPLTLLGAGAGEQSGAVVSVAGANTLNGIVTLGFDATLHAVGTLNLGNTTSVVALGDRSLTLTGAGLGTVQGSINLNEGTLIKNGTGRWTLAGAMTYENIAQLNGGLLVLDYRTSNTSKLNTSALITLNGGSLSLIGSDTAATSQASGGFTLLGGHADVTVANGAGQSATFGFGALNRTVGGGTINFTLPATGAITTGATATNGILGGFATVGGQDWAALNGFNLTAFTGYTPFGFVAANDTNNALLAASGTLLGNVTTNSLKIAGGVGVNLNANTLTLNSGGLLYTGNDVASIAGTGTLSAATANDDLLLHVRGGGTLDIGAPVIGFGVGTVVKAGTGTVVLRGTNNFSGNLNIGQGTLAIVGPGGTAHPAALGVNGLGRDIVINGGTFRVLGDYDPGINSMEVVVGQGGGTIRMDFGGAIILNDAGQLSGPGDLTLTGGGRYTIGQASTGYAAFTGKVTVESGVLNVVNPTALGGRAEQTITLKPGAVLINAVPGAVGVLGLPNNIVAEGNNQFYVGGGNRIYLGDIQFSGTNTIALFDRDNPGQERQVGMTGRLSGQNITLNIVGGQGLGQPLYLQSGTNDFTGTINLGPNAVLEARMPGSLGVRAGDITINLAQNSRLLLRHWQNADFLANVNVNETAEINSDRLVNYGGGGQHLMGINNLNVGSAARLLVFGGGNTYSTRIAGTATFNANTPVLVAAAASGVVFANGITFTGTATDFDKRGPGVVQLLGPATHAGDTILHGGTLLLRGANGALPNTTRIDLRGGELRIDNGDAINPNRVPDAASIVLAGGTLRLTGNETFGNFSAPVGSSQIVFNQASETTPGALTLNGFTRSLGATVQFQGPDFGPAYGATSFGQARISSRIIIPGQPDVTGNAVIPGLFGNSGLDFIQYESTLDGGVPLGVRDLRNPGATVSSPTPYQNDLAETAWSDSVILRNTTAKTLTANRALEALKFEGAVTIALGTFNLRIETGGIIGATANATFTTAGGTVTAGPAVPGVNPAELFFSGNNTMLFDPTIVNNGTQPVALVKSGSHTLSLRNTTAASTFTGGVFVNSGTLDVWRGRLLGPANNLITLAGGQLNINVPDASSGIVLPDFGHNVTVVGNAIIQVDNNGETTGTGTNNLVGFGSLAINGPYTLTARGFDGYDMSFNGITLTGRPSIDLIQGNTGGNGTSVVLGGVLAGSGFNVLSTGNTASTAAVLVIGSGPGDTAHNTYNGRLVLVGGGVSGNQNAPVVQLNKAPGTNAITGEVEINGGILQLAADNQIPDTTELQLNGGSVDFNGRNETVAKVTKRGGAFRTNAGTAVPHTITISGDFLNTGTGNFATMEDVQIASSSTMQVNGLFRLDAFTRAVLGASDAQLVLGGGLEMTGTTITQSSGAGLNIIRLLSNVQTFPAAAPANLGNSTDSDTFLELDGIRTFTIADGPAGLDFQISSVIRNNTAPANPGGLVKAGSGTMQLQGGGTANSYTGPTSVNEGTLVLFKNAGVNAINSTTITVGDGVGGARADRLVVRNSNQINDSAEVAVSSSGLFDLASFDASEAIAALSGAGAVDLGPTSTLTLTGTANTVFSGSLRGGGAVSKTGTGAIELSGTSEYLGPTIVTAGTLLVTGALHGTPVTISGGTLAGNGTISSSLTANGTSFVAPGLGGTTTAQLQTGSLNLDTGSTTTFDLNGNVAGALYDQLKVSGTVTLAGALSLTLGYTPTMTENLAIILNDGSDAVFGTFAGLPEGALVGTFGAVNVFITYQGNADGGLVGNDVLLTVPEPSTAALLLGALGVLGLRRQRR